MSALAKTFSDPTQPSYRLWQSTVAIFIFVSCIALALETVPEVEVRYHAEFLAIEWISVAIFTIDYLGTLFFSEEKAKYAFSVWGIIDLVSILPSYLMLLNLTALQGTKVLRLLRVARVLRVLKLARTAIADQAGSQNPILVNLRIYFIIFFSVMMISSTAMFFFEGGLYSPDAMAAGQHALDMQAQAAGTEPEKFMPVDPMSGSPIPEDKRFFTSIPIAMWWCIVTLTSTGYGDMFPVTAGGRIVAGITMFLGLVLFGILLNVIGKTLMVVLFGEKLKADE
jgi:voltage-gated potassium channel